MVPATKMSQIYVIFSSLVTIAQRRAMEHWPLSGAKFSYSRRATQSATR